MVKEQAADREATASLTSLSNIAKALARWLIVAGIDSPEALREAGSVEAALRLAPHRPPGSACRSALCALEGALRGVRWHSIPKVERDALWNEYLQRRLRFV
ncbi:MAG: TfoX/Sxy family DNA transformation protein [Candidatus Bipolaricaulota bacterium]|nr:MAG: TfoX/Sxy family DNA transformation protein [Candidatus Bipolaricaulota bacterium]